MPGIKGKDTAAVQDASLETTSISDASSSVHHSAKIVPINNTDNTSVLLTFSNTKPTLLVVVLTFVTSISGFLFGYDTGYISSALVAIGQDLDGHTLHNGQKELITSATSLGALIGAIFAGLFVDFLGRRPTIMGSNVLFIVGSAMQTGAHSVGVMMGGRFVMGIGVGIGSLTAPLFISEMAPSNMRGRLVVVNVLCITGGQLIAYAIGAGVEKVSQGWRILVGLSILPPTLQLVAFFFLPDTPRFYLMKNRVEEAKNVLLRIYPEVDEKLIDAKIQELIAINNEVPGDNFFKKIVNATKEIHTVPSNFRALLISCGLQGIQQFSSWNSLMYFSATIFQTVGFKNSTAVSIIIAGTNFVFTLVAFFAIDRIGRRRILLFSLPCMVAALVVCAIAFHFLNVDFSNSTAVIHSSGNGISGWGVVIIVAMICFAASYAIGIGNVPWQQSELFPQSVRGVGCAYCTGVNWGGSLIIAATFLTMMQNITPTGTFAFFAGLITVSWLLVFFMYPELSGLELEETQKVLTNGFNIKESERLAKERRRQAALAKDQINATFASEKKASPLQTLETV
ncbi:myo-inositol transporter [Saccharomycopsis crataegensis]|uniref:Myo-inositol transporter n=1 Tax=Saccharomycopsis crataegensis TaxID=43959 RepID=A0AAV5QTJ0_9ASCO|nr:myo-inositol transporter [Saccharomycopsis crataegensis]